MIRYSYGSEAWNTTKAQLKRVEVFHQRCLRRILRIKWFHHVRNEDVLKVKQAKATSIEYGDNNISYAPSLVWPCCTNAK